MSSEPPQRPKPIAPGNHEKAWNDPPLFSVEVNTQRTGTPRANKLTGRVGFPLNQPGAGGVAVSPNFPNSSLATPPTANTSFLDLMSSGASNSSSPPPLTTIAHSLPIIPVPNLPSSPNNE